MRDYASLYSCLLSTLGVTAGQAHAPITSDMGHGFVSRLSLASSFYKKLCPSGNSKIADANALKKFKAINDSIPEGPFRFDAHNEAESCFYDYFRSHLNRCLSYAPGVGDFTLESVRSGLNIGPGASQLADSSTLHTKLFGGTLSYTNPDLIRLYRSALADTGLWADAEMQRFQRFGFTEVRGGKVFFATKNAEISRTCCTEANLNMLIQMSVGAHIERGMESYFGLSLSTQPDLNRWLACVGSIHDSFGTMDLVSASDSIGNEMLMSSLDNNFLKAVIRMSRSESVVLPDGSILKARMVSTMGNGFTFPLQMAIFASAVYAVYDLMGIPKKVGRSNNFGVFGDDIIVVKEAFSFLARCLGKLGFVVNVGKSFQTGVFRESCGEDYYRGIDVRGIYVTHLETPQKVYALINQLSRWSVRNEWSLKPVILLLRSWVRDMRVPYSEADDAGIKVPFDCTKPVVNDAYEFSYRCCKRRQKRLLIEEIEQTDNEASPYELGLGVGFLSGHLRRRDFSYTNPLVDPQGFSLDSAWKHDWAVAVPLRDRKGERARYNVVTKSIPWWDYWPVPKSRSDVPFWEDDERVRLTPDMKGRWETVLRDYFAFGE